MSNVWDDSTPMWLDMQRAPAAREVQKLLRALKAENRRLREELEPLRARCEHMSRGFPDGVTVEEWEIILELRRVAPPPERPSKEPTR